MINETMRLNVKMINSVTFPIDVLRKGSIGLLKQKIYEKSHMAVDKQKLIFQGKVLLNDKLISEYNLEDNDVIHLIENVQRNEMIEEESSNAQDHTFNELISNLFNRNPFRGLNGINSNNENNTDDIPEAFHHLINKNNFIQTEAIETITQGVNSLYEMIDRSKRILVSDAPVIKSLYSSKNNQFQKYKIGQWVDIQDQSDQWIEGQITNTRGNEVNVHYIGLTNQINHWVDTNSKRLALFRSYTSQNSNEKFASPFPNKVNSNNSISINPNGKYDPLTNDLITFFDLIKEKVKFLMRQKDAMKDSSFKNRDDFLNNERFFYLQQMQLYPLMDRLGRILIDISFYLMNMSFKFFEDNIYLFKPNIQDERLSFLDFHERNADLIRKNEIKQFIKLTEFSVIKMKKNEAEQRRPVLGLLVNVHRDDRRTRTFDNNTLRISQEETFDIRQRRKFIKETKTESTGIQTGNRPIFENIKFFSNEPFSIIPIIPQPKKQINTKENPSNVNTKSYDKINKTKTSEKVVLVSRDKPVSSTLASQFTKPSTKSNLKDNPNGPKKKYRLSQSKASPNNKND